MSPTFHQLCPRYGGTLTPTASTAIRLWETFTFFKLHKPTFKSYHSVRIEYLLCGNLTGWKNMMIIVSLALFYKLILYTFFRIVVTSVFG